MLDTHFKLFDQLPCICFWKDVDSRYIHINETSKTALKIENLQDIVGKSDYEMPWGNIGDQLREQDILSLKSSHGKFWIDMPTRMDGIKVLCMHKKTPFHSENGKVAGIVGVGFIIDTENYHHIPSLFACTGFKLSDFFFEGKQKEYIYDKIEFSKRQAQVISCLLRGYSAELTAKELTLSKRTIEFYIENLKDKLDCETKREIVNKAFELDFIDLMFLKIT